MVKVSQAIVVEQKQIASVCLNRTVTVDFYLPENTDPANLSLLLINDGQNLGEMKFTELLSGLLATHQTTPVLCAGIHAGKDRKNEYGTAGVLDYEGRGSKAAAYQQFILTELLPMLHIEYRIGRFRKTAFAGFSLGGLSALDMLWHHPEIFSVAGVFSGSLWWRTKHLDDDYDDERDRIMPGQIR